MFKTAIFFAALALPPLAVAQPPTSKEGPAAKKLGKFTISKETTYVTGPRDKDGYIDYAAALNERLRQGVTPENNANVLLIKAIGPYPEGAPMPAEFYKLIGIPELPKKGNYVVSSRRHITKHRELDPEREPADLLKDFDEAAERPWKTAKYPVVAGWLTVNEEPLTLVTQGLKRTHYFSPLVPRADENGRGSLIASLLPAVQRCRELAWFLQIRVMWHVGEGRPDAAWQDLLTCHRLGRQVARGGTLIEMLVGVAIDHIASHAELLWLENVQPDADKLRACLRDLQALPPLTAVADKIDLTERFMFLDTVMMMDRQGVKGGLGLRLSDEAAQSFLKGIDWDPALRKGNRWYDRLATTLRVKDRAAREQQLDQLEKELRELAKGLEDEDRLAKLVSSKLSSEARGALVGDALVANLIPAVRKVQMASDRDQQIQRNLHVAFALAIYQRDHGRYPKNLDELAPKYLAELPSDVFNGKALKYQVSKKGYLVYSVGPNGIDEGGRWYDDTPPGDDPRVIMPLPKRK
jgi:hypothetical protein